MPTTLLKSARYKNFVTQRNAALERIHQNAQTDFSRITFSMLEQIEHLSASLALKVSTAHMGQKVSEQFETGVRDVMSAAFPTFVKRILSLRKAAYILSHAGEMEAVGRATMRKTEMSRGDFSKNLAKEMQAPTILGPLEPRIWLGLMRLRHKIVKAFEVAVTMELKPEEIVSRVTDSFPQIQRFKRPKKVLQKVVRESVGDKDDDQLDDFIDLQFIDDGDWNAMVDAYTGTELPPNRFDNQPDYDSEKGYYRYSWEVEQEATEDFVRSVRSGQVDGAKAMGVQDFVWIAVIDNKTCEDCCLPRNGKTTTEIEQMNDDCDETVPPAHMNCRCDIGPVATTSIDTSIGPQWSDFDDWIKSA